VLFLRSAPYVDRRLTASLYFVSSHNPLTKSNLNKSNKQRNAKKKKEEKTETYSQSNHFIMAFILKRKIIRTLNRNNDEYINNYEHQRRQNYYNPVYCTPGPAPFATAFPAAYNKSDIPFATAVPATAVSSQNEYYHNNQQEQQRRYEQELYERKQRTRRRRRRRRRNRAAYYN
jgi:hypothetical protein